MNNKSYRLTRPLVPATALVVRVLAVLTLWTTCHAVVAQSQPTRWRLESDDRFQIEIEQATEMVSEVDQRSQTSRNQMTLNMSWRVTTVDDDGVASLVQTLDRIRLQAQVPTPTGAREVDLDTGDSQGLKGLAKQLYQLVSPLIGTEALVRIDPRGKIVSVEIPPESIEILRHAPASMQIRNVLTPEGIKQLFGLATVELPDANLDEQPAWTVRNEVTSALGHFEQTLEYTARRDDQASGFVIDMVNQLHPATDEEAKDEPAASTLKRFVGRGTYHFDTDQGILSDGSVTTELESERPYLDLVIQTTVKSEMKLTVKRVSDE